MQKKPNDKRGAEPSRPFVECLAQSARIATHQYEVALKQIENIEKLAKGEGYSLDRRTGALIREEKVINSENEEKKERSHS